ncbi:STAS domain-containing protein [Phytoactinopolyspora endophytica]|uniref:STAS domain-containing protein n=1 Tax=Phytoactinopolyspora endophytica TaxID=1642495 RepID=UPI00101D8AE6
MRGQALATSLPLCGGCHVPGNRATVRCLGFGGCVIVAVRGSVNVHRVDQIRAASAAADSDHIVLDLRNVSAIDASAAPALASLCRRAQSSGGSLCIVTQASGLRSRVRHAAPDCYPPFYDDIGEALEASMTARENAIRHSA